MRGPHLRLVSPQALHQALRMPPQSSLIAPLQCRPCHQAPLMPLPGSPTAPLQGRPWHQAPLIPLPGSPTAPLQGGPWHQAPLMPVLSCPPESLTPQGPPKRLFHPQRPPICVLSSPPECLGLRGPLIDLLSPWCPHIAPHLLSGAHLHPSAMRSHVRGLRQRTKASGARSWGYGAPQMGWCSCQTRG